MGSARLDATVKGKQGKEVNSSIEVGRPLVAKMSFYRFSPACGGHRRVPS